MRMVRSQLGTRVPTWVWFAFVDRGRAQDMVEYGLLIATVAIVLLVGITTFGQEMLAWFRVLAGVITTSGGS
jgi:Flp pilus assembly pilin Flp